MNTGQIKPLPEKTLNTFCAIFDFAKGIPDITSPATEYRVSCLAALERRGLIAFDTERVKGKNKRWAALTELGAHYGCESLALAQVPDGLNPYRNRVWVKVQFDLHNEDYADAYKIAGDLARARLLAPTIRDLLQIHAAADKGDYSLFYQLYGIPETKETSQFATMIQTFADMQQTINTLTAKLDSLQNAPQSNAIGVKSSDTPVQREKVHDDGTDDVGMEITEDVMAGKRANERFLKAVFSLQDEHEETAPVGLRAGNIPQFTVSFDEDDME